MPRPQPTKTVNSARTRASASNAPAAAVRHRPLPVKPAPSVAQRREDDADAQHAEDDAEPPALVALPASVQNPDRTVTVVLREGELYGLGTRQFHKNKPALVTPADAEILAGKFVTYAQVRGTRMKAMHVSRFEIIWPEEPPAEETGGEGDEPPAEQ